MRKLTLNTAASKKAIAAADAKTTKPSRTVVQAKTKAKVEVVEAPKGRAVHEGMTLTYSGPSPTVRGHGRRLSPVRLDLGAKAVTARDESFIRDLRAKYGMKAFHRYDLDAGCTRRAVDHGFMVHVGGDLASREATFRLTDKGMSYAGASSRKAK